jgi:hypothetical protein
MSVMHSKNVSYNKKINRFLCIWSLSSDRTDVCMRHLATSVSWCMLEHTTLYGTCVKHLLRLFILWLQ